MGTNLSDDTNIKALTDVAAAGLTKDTHYKDDFSTGCVNGRHGVFYVTEYYPTKVIKQLCLLCPAGAAQHEGRAGAVRCAVLWCLLSLCSPCKCCWSP